MANGINPNYRPVKTPHYGGHIERYMGTVAGELRNLPGATFSNPGERKGTDPEASAALTMSEFEAYLVDWIVNVYHQRPHAGLDGMTPAAYWRLRTTPEGDAPTGLVQRLAKDPERVRIDFMPSEKRGIERKGVLLNRIHYWDDAFRGRIGERDPENKRAKRKFLVRYDPRSLACVWVLDPDTDRYRRIQTWNKGRPPVSLWEWNAVKAHLTELGKKSYNEDRMFEALARLRGRVSDAVAKTKKARRQQQMAADAARHAAAQPTREPAPAAPDTVPLSAPRLFKPIAGVEF